ncbi:MAG: hypothetical protein ABSG55_05195 [Dehalococcoidia bacterium]
MPLVTGFEVELEREAALRLLRQRPGVPKSDDAWLKAVDAALAEGRRLARPAIAYEVFPVTAVEPTRLVIGDGAALESSVVAALFGAARDLVLMVYTVGPLLEARIDELAAQREYPVAFALDAVGSVALGKTGEAGYALIEEMAAARGVKASIPLNPGTSHWPLSGQRLIAEMVGAREIGVEARQSGVLHPFKSIAFAVALGEDVLTPAEGSSCDYCERRDLCL